MQIIDEMRATVARLILNVQNKLYGQPFQDLVTSDCRSAPMVVNGYLRALANCGITLDRFMTVQQYSDAGQIMGTMSLDAKCVDDHATCSVNNAKPMVTEAVNALKEGRIELKGMCLDCVRKKISGDGSIVCRLGHRSAAVGGTRSA